MIRKIIIISLFIFSFNLFSQDTNWVIRIKNKNGEVKKLITTTDFLSELTNITKLRGASSETINLLIKNDIQLWQFTTQLIEQELLFEEAVRLGYDKDDNVVKLIEKERDNQISQLYMQQLVLTNFANVSEEEKIRFFNNNKQRLQSIAGPNVTYQQLSREIEYTILQERMRLEYNKIIDDAKKKYKLEYSATKDPCIIIEDKSISLAEFNDTFNESLKQAGGNIPAALKVQARDNLFTAFLAREIMIYEAKKNNFYDTAEAKTIDKFITRNAVTANYIDKEIRAKLPKPTNEEINRVYEEYGQLYKIDSLPYEQAQKALETLVIEAKAQQQYQILMNKLRYENSIEKNFSSITNIATTNK